MESFEPQDVYVLSDLAQVKILADPLRVRILEALCAEELTTKQVADRLDEKPTKLYHHVEAMERVGLIRLTRTRQNRGTLEKYYRAVARTFQADAGLFSESRTDGDETPLPEVLHQLLDRTGKELTKLAASPAAAELQDSGVLGFCEVHASQEQIDELRRRLTGMLEELGKLDAGEAEQPERRYRLTLAFFPLDHSGADEPKT